MEDLPRRNEAVQIEICSFSALYWRGKVLVPQAEVQCEIWLVSFQSSCDVITLPPVVHAGGKGLDTDLGAGGEPEQKIGKLVIACGRLSRRL